MCYRSCACYEQAVTNVVSASTSLNDLIHRMLIVASIHATLLSGHRSIHLRIHLIAVQHIVLAVAALNTERLARRWFEWSAKTAQPPPAP